MSQAIPFGSERAKKAVDVAVRVAQQGLGAYYHPSVLVDVWRRARPEHWARLAFLARLSPEDSRDRILQAEVIDMLAALGEAA